jgi:predicted nicotinamide N-methyase
MTTPSPANLRAFVRRHTRLGAVPGLPGVRLHLANDVMTVYRLAGGELGEADPGLPFWAFAWAGGLAVARYLGEHPEVVAGRRVLDVASGSGLCAIVAMQSGAASAHAFDIDPFSEIAVGLNARANGVHIGFSRQDLLSGSPPPCDVILAGDVCYEETMAGRMVGWLRLAADRGTCVLIGDPGRNYLPDGLERLASYRVQTSRELEASEFKESAVYTFPALGAAKRQEGTGLEG